jgi:hypothetical protein
MLKFTVINHVFRKKNDLTLNEYCLLDMIYHLSVNPESKIKGWCYMKRETMANELGLSKQAILGIIEKIIRKGFLFKDSETKYLKTTQTWNLMYYTDGKESLPEVKKIDTFGKESLPKLGKESLPNIYSLDNNINTNNIKEEDFIKKVNSETEFSHTLKNEFINYWTEKSKTGKMRFEGEKYFDIKKRLNTWFRNNQKFTKEKSFAKKENNGITGEYQEKKPDSLF